MSDKKTEDDIKTAVDDVKKTEINDTKKPEEKMALNPENIDSYIEALKIMNAEKPRKSRRGLWLLISFFIMIAVAISTYLLTK